MLKTEEIQAASIIEKQNRINELKQEIKQKEESYNSMLSKAERAYIVLADEESLELYKRMTEQERIQELTSSNVTNECFMIEAVMKATEDLKQQLEKLEAKQ